MLADPPPLDSIAPPLPGRAIIRQRWSDLVFLHWRVAPAVVEQWMPPGTRPDIDANGDTWVGLIPFVLSRTQFFPPLPPVPYLGTFVECNVRLYSIDAAGNRGVVFRSLDAERAVPVLTARALFGLPYRWASMSVERAHPDASFDGTRRLEYRSRRLERSRGARVTGASAHPSDHVGGGAAHPTTHIGGGAAHPTTHIVARPGTTPVDTELSRFLTARWGFHEQVRGHTIWARNHHEPWPLVEATLDSLDDELLAAAGFPDLAARHPESVLYSPGVTTVFARPIRIAE